MVMFIKATDKDIPEKLHRLFLKNYRSTSAGVQPLAGSRLAAKLLSLGSKEDRFQVVSGCLGQKYVAFRAGCVFHFLNGLPSPL